MTPSPIKGLIFDLDGTLADTEPVHMEAWQSVLADLGLHFGHDWFLQFVGLADRVIAEHVFANYEQSVRIAELQENKRRAYHQLAPEKARLFPGVEKGLEQLARRYPMAIATSSSDLDAAAVFQATRVDRYFGLVITADDVPDLKPAPDCYRMAVEGLSLAPAECIAVEDSPAGITAASDAGLYTIGITSSQSREQLKHARRTFDDINQAMHWITTR